MDEQTETTTTSEENGSEVWNMNDEEFNAAYEDMFTGDSEEEAEPVEEQEEFHEEEEEEFIEEGEDSTDLEKEEEEEVEVDLNSTIDLLQKEGIPVQTKDELMYLVRKGMNQKTESSEDRKLLHMLRSAKVDGNKLNHLLDIADNKPEAIARMLQDSGLDAFDLEDKAEAYVPTSREVSSERLELDDTLADVGSSDSGKKLIGQIAESWDEASHEALGSSPQHLHVLNQHMQTGVFDTVQAEVKRQRMFGGLKGMSDLIAYQTVGAAMAKQGAFDKESKPATKKSASELFKGAVKPTRTPRGNKAKAGIGNRSAKSAPRPVKDIWKMSSAELEEYGNQQGLNY